MHTIVFDLDGTLIDSLPEVRACLNYALATMGRRPLSLEEVRHTIGDGASVTIARAFAITGAEAGKDELAKAIKVYLARYRERPVDHTLPFAGVPEVLEKLVAGGATMGICTNKPSATAGTVLKALGLAPFFKAVICGDEVPHPKPDRRHVTAILSAIGGPKHAVMVGDHAHDVTAAHAAGIRAIAVGYGYSAVPAEKLGADDTINSFAELPRSLARLFPAEATS